MRYGLLVMVLIVLLIIATVLSVGMGPLQLSPMQSIAILLKQLGVPLNTAYTDQQEVVVTAIRLPRVIFGIFIGATLAMCGTAIQGLFRNPLADPALIGISSGAALFTVVVIVVGLQIFQSLFTILGTYMLSIAAFAGAFFTTILIYRISQAGGKTIVSTMLLAGIAISAMAAAGTGIMTLIANDAQLRTITFWNLGSLGGASWVNVAVLAPLCLICMIGLPSMSKALNALVLGETNASHLGINVEALKSKVIILTALGIGACVSMSGIIGFVGLVTPHIVRKMIGPEHKQVFVASGLLGAVLLVIADLVCRTVVAPIEIPIGIATALIGAPFFLYLLLKERKNQIVF
ncbi:MAG: iron ABC transporter permease [Chitinophagaceae bacterium]|nr:iron ABC transporter permease [Chitinophagaceae bacterium]MCW5925881.1 iron ABC transporter permease [Chitinophagaceae bacterium]